ncbi:GGDEF domain-containing protein [Nodosilinea sp. LEGE 06152]|uniref:GGDEF domain-containing protein n=1 Tax=Nodosilinea sp. LEGE 06152 TaxID=2777966 RepID=UPI00187F072C|nr:GGDEF domain-containing protein [Nodosilinea sp. LEGE 06152]MBE9159512.1 GGDEF domain-containing protein [Nodosilinea sp. LEGE 06152]
MLALMPHGSCFLWDPWLTSLHAISDGGVLVAYFSIPLMLLLNRQHIDAQIRPVLLLFAAFIFSCGIGHGLRVWNIWHASYWLEGGWSLLTATVSLYTAWRLKELVPQLLNTHRDLVSIRRVAEHDPLTGIANRRGLEAALTALSYQPSSVTHSLVLVDLDGFKAINDTYGHGVGDQLLQAVARVLHSQIRAIDLAARIGGDEFVLLMVGCTPQEARDKVETIRQEIQKVSLADLPPGPNYPLISASFGISSFDCDRGLTFSYQQADAALYRAKHSGKNQVEIATSTVAQ